jgi:hypothetical protein
MNMLSDKLENDRKAIRRISDEHQNLVTVLVHGIKTPAANIKLLAEAIATGLYDPEGKINEKDAELELQKIHDKFIKKIDDLLAAKNKEIMTV